MRDLCSALKISSGALYCYFPSKEAIIERMVELDQERWTPFIESISPNQPFAAQLDMLEKMGEAMTQQQHLSLCCQINAEAVTNPRVRSILHRHYAIMTEKLALLIRNSQATGAVSAEVSPHSIANFMISAYDGLFCRMAIDPEVDFHAMSAEYKQLIARAVAPNH